ncbi:Regulator of chromosome condensation [Trypanosoma melophagium]|uniref:Regulator of chromosome condensation n=1 Tax=Trypanosoma melophagium TaxID=715481 RepID=UPI00351A1B3D|nr:Regulator of chromosome condensation [Trypanosoma melophagium]
MYVDPNNLDEHVCDVDTSNRNSQTRIDQVSCTPACSLLPRRREWVKLNVGGVYFTTTVSTLCADRDSLLPLLINSELDRMPPIDKDSDSAILLDLDPVYFRPILNYLRHRVLVIPPGVPVAGVLAVAEYLNLQGVVRQLTPERHARRQLLYSWGSGASGELGTQCFQNISVPTLAPITPFGVRVVDVALGANYSCALTDDGNIYTFGNGDWGQLGLGSQRELDEHPDDKSAVIIVPQRIPLFEQEPAVHVAAGYAYAMALTADHHVYFWGNNNHGQSGLGPRHFDHATRKVETPTLVATLEGRRIVQLGCGSFFSLALGDDGTLYSWGLLECLGLGTAEEVRARVGDPSVIGESLSAERRTVVLVPQVVHVETKHKLVRVHAGQWHSGAINAAGELFTWGVGYQGRLGHGDKEPALVPRKVRGALTGKRVVDVACGSFHTVALTDSGAVYCWGDNASGQCGAKESIDSIASPYRVVNLEFVAGGVVKAISCGRQHTVVVMQGPQSWCRRPCCSLDHSGRPRAPHGQVFTFGETARMGCSTTAGNNGSSNNNNNNGSGVMGGSLRGVMMKSHDGRVGDQFRIVPLLRDLNVTNVKSGLHHTFVFAEELIHSEEAAAEMGDFGDTAEVEVMDDTNVHLGKTSAEWIKSSGIVHGVGGVISAAGRKVR